MPTQRQLRAGELIRHAVSDILAREDLRDPDLIGVIVTVGEVRCSPDLRHANVFVSPLGDDTEPGRAKLAAALNRAAGFLRGRLGREIDMKFTPQLHFIADKSYDEATAIDRLLADPRVKRDIGKDWARRAPISGQLVS
jgi:ribosome-binding factor A